jgi:hypothetical protein
MKVSDYITLLFRDNTAFGMPTVNFASLHICLYSSSSITIVINSRRMTGEGMWHVQVRSAGAVFVEKLAVK